MTNAAVQTRSRCNYLCGPHLGNCILQRYHLIEDCRCKKPDCKARLFHERQSVMKEWN